MTRFGVMFQDASIAQWWSGRTAFDRARDFADAHPYTLVVQLVDGEWEEVWPLPPRGYTVEAIDYVGTSRAVYLGICLADGCGYTTGKDTRPDDAGQRIRDHHGAKHAQVEVA